VFYVLGAAYPSGLVGIHGHNFPEDWIKASFLLLIFIDFIQGRPSVAFLEKIGMKFA